MLWRNPVIVVVIIIISPNEEIMYIPIARVTEDRRKENRRRVGVGDGDEEYKEQTSAELLEKEVSMVIWGWVAQQRRLMDFSHKSLQVPIIIIYNEYLTVQSYAELYPSISGLRIVQLSLR